MRHPLMLAALAVGITTTVVGVGMTSANSAEPQEYSTSTAVASQSMVAGSSPTSLGASSLARTPAGKAAAAVATDAGEYTTSAATVQYETPAGKVIATKHYGPKSMGKVLPAFRKVASKDSGTGGSSSASGCVRVTVTQTRHTTLGAVAWRFAIWTDWCWTRSNQVVSYNDRGHRAYDIDSQHQYHGIDNAQAYFYDFSTNDGHPKSAYYHYEQAEFTNCVFKYGCLSTSYPENTLRSYYNGTWVWETDS